MNQVGTFTGKENDYFWLTSTDLRLGDLIHKCPEIVLNRYVAVTTFDSGRFEPTESEKRAGWQEDGEIAWSPLIKQIGMLSHDGYDEWYVFESHVRFEVVERFVNLGGFGLRNPDYLMSERDPTWDRVIILETIERINDTQERFWKQLNTVRPESYLVEGDDLVFAPRISTLFDDVGSAFGKRV